MKVNDTNLVDCIIQYESGDLGDKETLELFSYLIKTRKAFSLQGHYGRTAYNLMQEKVIDSKGNILTGVD